MSTTVNMPGSRLWAAYWAKSVLSSSRRLRTPQFAVPTLFFPIGVATQMIPRNTTIPTKKTETFSTRLTASHRLRFMCCRASGLWQKTTALWVSSTDRPAAAPRGVPQIEVTFDIDANGILKRDRERQGHEQGAEDPDHLFFRPEQGRSGTHGQRSRSDASEDKTKREEIEARNQLDSMVYQVEKI